MSRVQQYLDKNAVQFEELNAKLATGEYKYLLVSCEMEILLRELQDEVPDRDPDREYFKYKGTIVILMPYLPAGAVYPIKKADMIHFTMKCLCGHWLDEPHP